MLANLHAPSMPEIGGFRRFAEPRTVLQHLENELRSLYQRADAAHARFRRTRSEAVALEKRAATLAAIGDVQADRVRGQATAALVALATELREVTARTEQLLEHLRKLEAARLAEEAELGAAAAVRNEERINAAIAQRAAQIEGRS